MANQLTGASVSPPTNNVTLTDPAKLAPAPTANMNASASVMPPSVPKFDVNLPSPADIADITIGPTQEWKVDPSQMVEGRIGGIINATNPLTVQAQTRALQKMNERGLANSSMAIGAAESALYDYALPIATQDAQINASANKFNAEQAYRRAADQAALSQQIGALRATEANRMGLARGQLESEEALSRRDLTSRETLAGQEMGLQERLAAEDRANRLNLANLQIAGQKDLAGMDITSRERLAGMDIASREKLTAAQLALSREEIMLKDRLAMEQMGLSRSEIAQRERLAMEQMGLSREEIAQRERLTTAELQQKEQLAREQMGISRDEITSRERLGQAELASREALAKLDADTRREVELTRTNLDNASREKLAGIEAENRTTLQTNASAANMYSSYMQTIAAIQSGSMDEAAKATAIDNAMASMRQGLGMLTELSGVDFSKFFVNSSTGTPASTTPAPSVPQPDVGIIGGAGGGRITNPYAQQV